MRRLIPCLLFVLTSHALAADMPTVAQLEAIGATVKQKGDVITELGVDADKLSDTDFQLINRVSSLQRLSISGAKLDDSHLAMLNGLVNLESFMSNSCQLSDDGFRHFAQFPKLRSIALFHPSRGLATFTGAGLGHLKDLPQLDSLTFAGATTGDAAMTAVATLTQLKSYRQWHNQETAAGLKELNKLPNLTSLMLGQRLPGRPVTPASLSGAAIADIAKIASLEKLDLNEARFTADDLQALSALPKLKSLGLKKVAISAEDLERLKKALPSIKIVYEASTPEELEDALAKKLKI